MSIYSTALSVACIWPLIEDAETAGEVISIFFVALEVARSWLLIEDVEKQRPR